MLRWWHELLRWWHELLRWWHEDRHYLSRPGLGAVFATITNFALAVLRTLQPSGDSLVETAENIRYSPGKTLQILGMNGYSTCSSPPWSKRDFI